MLLGTAIALCFVPLFNLLAFEFAFALGIPVAICAGLAGVRARRQAPRAAWQAWGRAMRWAGGMALLPLVPITLNALRVRNCDYLEGLLFYALLPGLTVAIASGWGVLAATLTRRARLLFWGVLLGSIGWSIARFWLHPPVDAFNPFLGYYPGSIYDEVVPIGRRLLWSRAEDLLWALAAVALAQLDRQRRRTWVMAAGALLLAMGGRLGATAQHVHRDAAYVQAALGGHRATEHLDIYYPRRWSLEKIDALAHDLEFAYAELAGFLAVTPSVRPAIYLYPDQPTKKRLMGAGRTRIAKPWQRSMHVHSPKVGDAVSIHELAHVFSADLADGPLHLSMRGPLPHMGLIEGLAVAATWESGRLDGHHWTAAMRQAGVAPTLRALLSPTGFLSKNSRTAYTMCGSFVRFQHEQAGADAVEATYRNGHVVPIDQLDPLVTAWEAHLDALIVDPRALIAAKARFDRPAIFRKVCAHEVAAVRRAVRHAISRGDLPAALRDVDRLLSFVNRDVNARLTRIAVLVGLGRQAEAAEFAQAIIDDAKAGAAARLRAREWRADLAAARGDESAAAEYEALLDQVFNRDVLRRLAVKRAALDHPEGAPIIRLLTAPRGTPKHTTAAWLSTVRVAAPDWPVVRYLTGRRHLSNGERAEGEADLRAALAGALPHPALRYEAERLLARSAFDAGRYAEAAQAFDTLAARFDLDVQSGEVDHLRRWARRARFFGAIRKAEIDKSK